jgi:hypothetical protein
MKKSDEFIKGASLIKEALSEIPALGGVVITAINGSDSPVTTTVEEVK